MTPNDSEDPGVEEAASSLQGAVETHGRYLGRVAHKRAEIWAGLVMKGLWFGPSCL